MCREKAKPKRDGVIYQQNYNVKYKRTDAPSINFNTENLDALKTLRINKLVAESLWISILYIIIRFTCFVTNLADFSKSLHGPPCFMHDDTGYNGDC